MTKLQRILANTTAENPWAFAKAAGRDYLTPEDVTNGIEAGASVLVVAQAVLEAVEGKMAEDASLCAFVALKMFKNRT